jgi:hypothetical protein
MLREASFGILSRVIPLHIVLIDPEIIQIDKKAI